MPGMEGFTCWKSGSSPYEVNNEVASFRLQESAASASIVGGISRRSDGQWKLTAEAITCEGQHFIDILEPTIGNYVRKHIPNAPKRVKAAFAMNKGAVVDLPKSSAIGLAFAGLGWDTAKGEVDLDVSAVMLDASFRYVDAVFFGNTEAPGIQHTGDNLTGEGEGDDERIMIDFSKITLQVTQIFFVINIYTKGTTFAQVANPYCRVVMGDGSEFCRYQLLEAGNQQALMVARLFREERSEERWGFQAIGVPCRGQTFKDSMPAILQEAQKRPQQLAMTRTLSQVEMGMDSAPPVDWSSASMSARAAAEPRPSFQSQEPAGASPVMVDTRPDPTPVCGQPCRMQ